MKDNHPLWRNDKNTEHDKLERPFYFGVSGPTWQVPIAENNDDFTLISSPVPLASPTANRIIAAEIPALSVSQSINYDYPKRSEVAQVNLPSSTTRLVSSHYDPRFPLKQPVDTVEGPLISGTFSPITMIEKKIRKKKSNPLKVLGDISRRARDLGFDYNREDGSMIYDVKMKNEPDQTIDLHRAIGNAKKKEMGKTKIGVRSLHTHKKLN